MADHPTDRHPPTRPLIDNSFGRSACDGTLEPGDSPLEKAFAVADAAMPPRARNGRRWTVCPAADLKPGDRRIVEEAGISLGVFNIAGAFHAIRNVCPHIGAPLCRGSVHATHRPSGVSEFDPALHGRVLRCPWHGWEFDIPTGKGLYDAQGRVATYPVEVDQDGNIVVTV